MTKKEQDALREENARYSYEMKMLKHQADALGRGYDLLADKYRQAQIAESEQENMVDLKLIANAVLRVTKSGPRRTPIVVGAAALGFALACLGVILRRAVSAQG